MRELRTVTVSEDGGHVVVADPAAGPEAERYRIPVDDRLRSALRDRPRTRPEARTESALSPREIQARLRAGESAAEVARAAGISIERVQRYEGPVIAERARVVGEARAALLPKDPGGVPGRPLGDVVDGRLLAAEDDPAAAQWDAWRRLDGIWLVQLTSDSRCARWTWDPVVRRVRPHDDAARALVAAEPGDADSALGQGFGAPGTAIRPPGARDDTAAAPVATRSADAAAGAAGHPAGSSLRPPTPALMLIGGRPTGSQPAGRGSAQASPNTDHPAHRPVVRQGDHTAAPTDQPRSGEPALRPAGRQSERAAAGRRGRKPVPSWDDIVFGARRP